MDYIVRTITELEDESISVSKLVMIMLEYLKYNEDHGSAL